MAYATTYKIGNDLEIKRMGFGAMRITGPGGFGMPEDKQNSLNVLQRAVELGVNFIDTADMYGTFTSELMISEALHPYPDGLVIATKGGIVRFGPNPQLKNDATPQHLDGALDGSLHRLQLEQIALYQLHRIDPDVPAEKTFEFLSQAQQAGKVKHLGLSEVSINEIKLAQQHFTVASVQNKYSVDNRAAEEVLQYCLEQNIAFIPWFPIGGGEDMKGTDTLQSIADAHSATPRQIALAWLLHHADNILLIPGTSSIDHLEENMAAADIDLSDDEIKQLDAIDSK